MVSPGCLEVSSFCNTPNQNIFIMSDLMVSASLIRILFGVATTKIKRIPPVFFGIPNVLSLPVGAMNFESMFPPAWRAAVTEIIVKKFMDDRDRLRMPPPAVPLNKRKKDADKVVKGCTSKYPSVVQAPRSAKSSTSSTSRPQHTHDPDYPCLFCRLLGKSLQCPAWKRQKTESKEIAGGHC